MDNPTQRGKITYASASSRALGTIFERGAEKQKRKKKKKALTSKLFTSFFLKQGKLIYW